MDYSDLFTSLAADLGPAAIFLFGIIYIWRAMRKDKKEYEARASKKDDYIRDILVDLVERTAVVVSSNTAALKANTESHKACSEALNSERYRDGVIKMLLADVQDIRAVIKS